MFGRRRAPLTGAPANPRLKTYSAQSGYVYQYFFLGQRAGRGGIEYVFDVSADRKTYRPVEVLVLRAALDDWERSHDRSLAPRECYAVAKIALFQAFDERPTPTGMRQRVEVRETDARLILDQLGIE